MEQSTLSLVCRDCRSSGSFLVFLSILFFFVLPPFSAKTAAIPGLLPYGAKGEEVQIRSTPTDRPPLFSPKSTQRTSPSKKIARKPAQSQDSQVVSTLLPAAEEDDSSPKAVSTKSIQLFGTVEFKRPLASLPAWIRLLERNRASTIFTNGSQFTKTVLWEQFKREAQAKKGLDLIRYVHSFWNRFPYREDIVNWKVQDYWAIPKEFLQKSGDCEDYAIVKYFTLKELGIPAESMRIVVLRDTVRNLAHAVLVVYLNGDAYVLDNLSSAVLSHKHFRHYVPQYSINEFSRWAHLKGRPVKSSSNANAR